MKAKRLAKRWIVPAACLALALAMAAVWWRGWPIALRPDAERQQLLTEKAQLAAFTTEARELLRSELADREARLWEITPSIGSPWQMEGAPADAKGTPHVRYTLVAPIAWAEITAVVRQLAAGGWLESLDIRSRGSLSRRDIASVVIVARSPPRPQRRARPIRGRPRPPSAPILIRSIRKTS